MRQQFSLVLTVAHATTQFMHGLQQKAESLHKFNIEFSEVILAIKTCEPKDVMYPLKIYMYGQKLFNQAISCKTTWHAQPAVEKSC